MLPVHFASIPERLIRLSETNPDVFCNLRPHQRLITLPETAKTKSQRFSERHTDSYFVYAPVKDFLKSLEPKAKVLMHFQGYSAYDLGTAVVQVDSLYWVNDYEGYPRLDFKHPSRLKEIHGCPFFWGAFILAITLAPQSSEVFACRDRIARQFIHQITHRPS